MTDGGLDARITHVAQEQSIPIPALEKAWVRTEETFESFRTSLEEALPPSNDTKGLDVVFCGSLARHEFTEGGDADYLILVDRNVRARTLAKLKSAAESAVSEEGMEGPGQQGLFGDFAIAQELVTRIGLQADSNIDTTRRLLILTESASVYDPQVRQTVLRLMIERYCADYDPEEQDNNSVNVPRFLLNDLVRYWRTKAVDFAAKRWGDVAGDSRLRLAKLLTTRKVLFAGSLAVVLLARSEVASRRDGDATEYDAMVSYLLSEFERTPLARLAGCYDKLSADGKAAMGKMLGAYDEFLDIVEGTDKRDLIRSDEGVSVHERLNVIAEDIEQNLEIIFFDDPLFKGLTRKYSLF